METLLASIITLGLIILIGSFYFVRIPINHLVMVEIYGRPVHIMGHQNDVEYMKTVISKITDNDQKDSLNAIADAIKVRESFLQNPCTCWMVWLFNLHFKHWNPFARLRMIKVSRTKENPKYDASKGISTAILNEDENDGDTKDYKETSHLRVRIRRVGVSLSRELTNDVGIDLFWLATEFTVINPWYAFVTSPNPTVDLDNQITGAWNNLCSCLTYEEFQKLDTGAKHDNPLNKYFREKPEKFGAATEEIVAGITSIGMILTGTISVGDYSLSGDQQKLKEAKARQAAAQANLAASELEAQADAAKIREEGKAQAEVIQQKGDATGYAATKLREGIGGDQFTAQVLANQALAGGSITTVAGKNTGLIIQPPAKPGNN